MESIRDHRRDVEEFDQCLKAWQHSKSYPVWKQPHIPVEAFLIRGEQDSVINELLCAHEFGWGFSKQGIHTWITRFDELKECNWLGAPSRKYQTMQGNFEEYLFWSRPLEAYFDYHSHVLIFPPKTPPPIHPYPPASGRLHPKSGVSPDFT